MVRRVLRVLSVAGIVGSTLLLGLAGTSSAVSKPKLTVTPSTNLKNGSTVKVSGTGFKAKDQIYITECLAKATGEAGCSINSVVGPFKITSKGVLPTTKFKLSTGKIGTGTCGTTKANLKKCSVSAGTESGTDSAVFVVTFALPKKK